MAEWICRIDEVSPGIYLAKNCSTGDVGIQFDTAGLPLGSCESPSTNGCILVTNLEIESGDGPLLIASEGKFRKATTKEE